VDEFELRWLADQLEIRNLIARLAHIADDGDLGLYATCYAEDVVWVSPPGPDGQISVRHGIADVVDGSRQRRTDGVQGPGTHVRHVVSTTEVTQDGADRAIGSSYFRMYANADTKPEVRAMGVYIDEFTRTQNGWRMSHRTISAG